jgi:hypothetical protein
VPVILIAIKSTATMPCPNSQPHFRIFRLASPQPVKPDLLVAGRIIVH